MKDDRFDPGQIFQVLDRHQVDYVVIGGIAGRLWGSPTITRDLDVCYQRDKANLERLAAALKELNAHLRGVREDVPFQLDARTLAAGDSFTFETSAGDFDCLGTPTGTNGFSDLKREADRMEAAGVTVWVASVDDLIRMKRAAGRPKDRVEVEILGAVREELKRRRR